MTSHVYITINLFNLCQQSYLPFNIYFFKCWHRLNEPLGGVGFNAVHCKTCSMLLRVLEQPRVDNSSVEFLKQEPNWLKTGPDIHVLMTWFVISQVQSNTAIYRQQRVTNSPKSKGNMLE